LRSDGIFGAPPSYWADLNRYDPAKAAAELTIPMLILQGDREYQVTLSNLDRFRSLLAGHPNVEIHERAGVSHLFIAGSGPGNPQEYDLPAHVDGRVIDLIVAFVGRLPAR
jgi:hypothetical protein